MTPDRWKQIKQIAGDAWAHAEAERDAYVATACGGDEALSREVLGLLFSMAQAGHPDAFTGRIRRDAVDPQSGDPPAANRRRDQFSET